jgi:hypothetical protein
MDYGLFSDGGKHGEVAVEGEPGGSAVIGLLFVPDSGDFVTIGGDIQTAAAGKIGGVDDAPVIQKVEEINI